MKKFGEKSSVFGAHNNVAKIVANAVIETLRLETTMDKSAGRYVATINFTCDEYNNIKSVGDYIVNRYDN